METLPVVKIDQNIPKLVQVVIELVDYMDKPIQINPDGTTKWIIGVGKKGKRTNVVPLKQLQDAVGGPIELLYCLSTSFLSPEVKRKRVMYVNEDGKLRNLPVNPFATLAHGRTIVGSVVLMPNRRSD